jgi:acetyl-CoA carboxylase biotin carboxyl carrier protein
MLFWGENLSLKRLFFSVNGGGLTFNIKGIKETEVELKQIKELMASMGRTGIKRLTLKKENFELIIEREEQLGGRHVDSPSEFSEEAFKQPAWSRTDQALSRGSEMPVGLGSAEAPKEDVNSKYVTSPMVGTCYTSPSPEDPPFIKVGDKVDKNSVVCIIEAMKVMNEIKANVVGTVAEVLIDTGQPVEFGSKLFRIVE